ncbi:MAG: DnaJ domain-containing protein [Acidobacteria bacterium]|nr:DnaJ domain-containing protein [Acidobacteriota bacterium]MBV9474699.1 DnaJ domain-containing protein [Acidobacteriota bacterium]
MEIVAIVFMLGAGGALATFVFVAMSIARREREHAVQREAAPAASRDAIGASLLVHVLVCGRVSADEALRQVRRRAGLAAPVTTGIDVTSWSESYARVASVAQRATLLETAVQLVASTSTPIPLRQYAALLDLSFGLGFQTDALAKLREQYGFEYVDHAKDARPRGADHKPLFERAPRARGELFAVLGVADGATRAEVVAAYRKLVAQHHPDRFHGAAASERSAAAARFIELTKAYEELLAFFRD